MINFSGPLFSTVDNRLMSLKLVQYGLTNAVMFSPKKDAPAFRGTLQKSNSSGAREFSTGHSQLCILQTLCEGAKTDAQIATATSLSQRDVSFHLERLLNCGCVKAEDAEDSVFYGLSAPWLLQLEGIVDEMLIAALKGHRASLNYD